MVVLQSYCRMYLVQKTVRQLMAAIKIQKIWRGYKCRKWLKQLKAGVIVFQAHCRGFKLRQMVAMGQYNKRAQVRITDCNNTKLQSAYP